MLLGCPASLLAACHMPSTASLACWNAGASGDMLLLLTPASVETKAAAQTPSGAARRLGAALLTVHAARLHTPHSTARRANCHCRGPAHGGAGSRWHSPTPRGAGARPRQREWLHRQPHNILLLGVPAACARQGCHSMHPTWWCRHSADSSRSRQTSAHHQVHIRQRCWRHRVPTSVVRAEPQGLHNHLSEGLKQSSFLVVCFRCPVAALLVSRICGNGIAGAVVRAAAASARNQPRQPSGKGRPHSRFKSSTTPAIRRW